MAPWVRKNFAPGAAHAASVAASGSAKCPWCVGPTLHSGNGPPPPGVDVAAGDSRNAPPPPGVDVAAGASAKSSTHRIAAIRRVVWRVCGTRRLAARTRR